MTYSEASAKLAEYGQEHILKDFDALNGQEQETLLAQIETLDFSVTAAAKGGEQALKRGTFAPLAAMQLPYIESKKEMFTRKGLAAIRAGKVGAVLLAGGMGTRLGFEGPKGVYDIGLTHPVYIFQRLIENLLDVTKQAGVMVPLYVMTSDKNHVETVRFFADHNYFGYDPAYVAFFMQAMAPATDYDGRVYMEDRDKIATSPNGNGGWFTSMKRCGLAADLHRRGVEWLNVFAVDNVLQRIADPCFVGASIVANVDVGAKVVRKAAPDEKVGVICLEDGRPSIVEYYDLTQEMMDAKDEAGDPAYLFGVILNYLFRVSKLEKLADGGLPVHVVNKQIPYMDEQGAIIHPAAPNGYKFEQLVLDMIHEMDSCLPFEVERNREFAPIKNEKGVDSVESARELCRENGIIL